MTPEYDLAAAVIERAINDLTERDPIVRQTARRFLQTELWESIWDDYAQLNKTTVLEALAPKFQQSRSLDRRAGGYE